MEAPESSKQNDLKSSTNNSVRTAILLHAFILIAIQKSKQRGRHRLVLAASRSFGPFPLRVDLFMITVYWDKPMVSLSLTTARAGDQCQVILLLPKKQRA